MSLELQDLRWAIAASQHRSIRQAAETLGIRQSTLSRHLRSLENIVGAQLFERTNGGTRPTPAGQEFLQAACRIIEETDEITVRLRTRARGESGQLTIGVHASLSAGNLRATIIDHHKRYPEVDLSLVDGSSQQLVSDLNASSIDVAFVLEGGAKWNGKSLAVWSERLVAALASDHPLAEREFITWSDLGGERIVLPQGGPGPEFLSLVARKMGGGDGFNVLRQDVSLDRLLTLAGAGCGIILALEGATGAAYRGVTFREVHGSEGATRLNFQAQWRETNSNPSLLPFLEMLRERYPDFSAAPSL